MIGFVGWGSDSTLARAVTAAVRLGVEHVVIDQEDLAGHDLDGDVLCVPGGRLRLDDLEAAYARPLAVVAEPDHPRRLAEETILAGLVDWLDVADARIVNRPAAMHSNASKPYQAQLVAAAGFEVPRTLVSNDPDQVRDFAERIGPLVFKSTSGIRSIVRPLTGEYVDRLERVRHLPTQFQERVDGVDVRVHVIGTEVFATRIQSSATDYRYAAHDGLAADLAATDLPDDVAQRCVDLAARLGLAFTGIDLRKTPDGRFVCFEANPMPGYSYFEEHTAQPISEALVRHLAGK